MIKAGIDDYLNINNLLPKFIIIYTKTAQHKTLCYYSCTGRVPITEKDQ